MKKPSKATVGLAFAAATLILPLTPAQADVCILGGENNTENVGSPSSHVSWNDESNWTPHMPGSADSVNWAPTKTNSYRHAYVELDADYEIASTAPEQSYRCFHFYKAASAVAPVTFTINTQLNYTGYTHCHEVYDGVKLVLPVGSNMTCSKGDHDYSGIAVKSGGAAELRGSLESRVMKFEVENDGTLVFAPTSYTITSWGRSDNDHDEINISGGTASFPNGIAMTGIASTPNNQVNQTGGAACFGGNFTSQMSWDYAFSGGTIAATDDVVFGANIALSIPASASVTLDVASGKTFSAPNFTADATASITKTGAGIFAWSPTTASVAVSEGGLALGSGTYDLSSVTFASGTTIALASLGGTVNSYDSSLTANATFTADLSGATVGTVVFISSDSTLRSKVETDLADSLPSGMSFVTIDNALILTAETAYDKIYDASGEIADIPGAGSSIAITGSGTVVTLSTAESIDAFKALGLIEVKDGAKLTISTDVNALPPIKLNMDATLEIAGNATVTLADQANLACVAMASHVPALSVASGATLNVPGGMKFSNIGISLQGTIASTSAGGIRFGYAGAGETTYIGLSSSGGTISVYPGSGDYNTSVLAFCYPEVGGTVNAVGSLSLASTTILPRYTRSGVTYNLTTDHQIGLYIGVNNPAATPFEVVFDNTSWGVMGSFYIKGGATLRLSNGSSYQNFESLGYWGRYAEIAENGKLVVGNGCEFRLNALGDYGTHELAVNPSTTGHQAIVVEDGGVFENYRFSGNGKAAFIASNSVYRIYMPSIYCEYEHSDHSIDIYDNKNVPFEGLASVDIADGDTMTFTTRNMVFWDVGQFASTSGARVVTLADVPITGGGSVALSNNDPNIFGVIVRSGANAATGTASVVPPAAGKGDTTLYFADGANWAGTVVADGNVAITNLVDAASPVTCSFGTLNLAADFPIRVWKSEGVVTNDTLNVGTYTGSGCIRVTGAELDKSEVLTIGTIGENAELPAKILVNGARYEAVVDNGFLKAKAVSGMTIVIR